MERWPNLTEVFAGLRWAIAGAVATRSYMPERATRDLDVVVFIVDEAASRAALEAAGFVRLGELSIPGSSWRSPSGQEVDVLLVDGDRWLEALARAEEHRQPDGSPVLALPDLVLMKLRSGRSQDVADVVRMLGFAASAAIDAVREAVAGEAPELCEDLESMIQLGKLEHESDSSDG
jgi:hypothetical protein